MYQQAQAARKWSVLPSPAIAAIENWDDQMRHTVVEAVKQRVGTLFGVPAYLERFLAQAAQYLNTNRLQPIWPLLDEIYYSGTGMNSSHKQISNWSLKSPLTPALRLEHFHRDEQKHLVGLGGFYVFERESDLPEEIH